MPPPLSPWKAHRREPKGPGTLSLRRRTSATDRLWLEALGQHLSQSRRGFNVVARTLWDKGYDTPERILALAKQPASCRGEVLFYCHCRRLPAGISSFVALAEAVHQPMTDGRTLRRLFRSVYCRPPPVRVDGTLEYLVDDVLSAKDGPKAGQHLYEVAWKGYSPAERTWESRDALADTPQMRAAPETVWDVWAIDADCIIKKL